MAQVTQQERCNTPLTLQAAGNVIQRCVECYFASLPQAYSCQLECKFTQHVIWHTSRIKTAADSSIIGAAYHKQVTQTHAILCLCLIAVCTCRLYDALNKRDLGAVTALLAEDCVYDNLALHNQLHGKVEVR